MLQDLRQAARALAKAPGFTAAAVATLALGIGANTAIFSVVRSVLWRPLPFANAERLVRVGHARPFSGRPGDTFSPQDFEDLERSSVGFTSVAAYQFVPGLTGMNLTGSGEPARLQTAFVSKDFFRTLGTAPLLGRPLVAEENVPGRDRAVVLSWRTWTDRFGADLRIVGRTAQLNGRAFTVVGVMPQEFGFPSRAVDAWAPLSLMGEDEVPHRRDVRWLSAVARLSPNVSAASARSAVGGLFRRLAAAYPDSNAGFASASVEALSESLLGEVRRPLLILLAAVGLVLLILCANLAGLLLARASARRREIAIRTALGASRARVVRHLLMETLLLSAAGGAGGLAVALWGVALLPSAAGSLPRPVEIHLDAIVLGFAFAVSLLTGLAFGLAPALQASRADLSAALESGGRAGSPDRSRRTLLRSLVVAECLLAGVLLTGAGLLGKSFWRLAHVDPGLRADHVLALSITIPDDLYSDDERHAAYRAEILRRLAALPGVTAVGGSKTMPLDGGGEAYNYRVESRSNRDEKVRPEAGSFIVTPGYFRALGIPLVAGREFTREDLERGRRVLVVSRSFAREIWPGGNPIGKALLLGQKARFEVIGVSGDVRHEGLAQPPGGAVYVSASLFPRSTLKIFVRFSGDPRPIASAARSAIRGVNRNQPISEIATLPDILSRSVARPRFFMLLLVAFGAAALALAALGLYGTLSYGTRQRRREFGIRIALGAQAGDVLRLILREGAVLAMIGVALAVPVALAVSRLLGSLLYEVRPQDPSVLTAVVLFLVTVAIAASWLPARQAARVDPAEALRQE